jgi:hypothetical protein
MQLYLLGRGQNGLQEYPCFRKKNIFPQAQGRREKIFLLYCIFTSASSAALRDIMTFYEFVNINRDAKG